MTLMLWIWPPIAPQEVRTYVRSMHRAIELETLRRSILLLAPGSMAMTREDAVGLIAELQETGQRLEALRDALRQAMAESGDEAYRCSGGKLSQIWVMCPSDHLL